MAALALLCAWFLAQRPQTETTATAEPTGEPSVSPKAEAATPNLGTPRGLELHTEDGKVFPYIERAYDPPHVLPLKKHRLGPEELTSPEAVVTSLASALRNLDWEWYQSLWDEPSRKLTDTMFANAGYTPAQRVAEWREAYVGKDLHITRRIDMEGYALISIAPTDGNPNVWAALPPLSTKRSASGRWWLTHELRSHPIPAKDMGLAQVQIVERGAQRGTGTP